LLDLPTVHGLVEDARVLFLIRLFFYDHGLIVVYKLRVTQMLAQGVSNRLFLLSHHAYEVSLHGTFETVFVLFRVNDGGDLASIDYALELALEYLVERVLLHKVYDSEAHLLPLRVYDGQQGIVDDV
jgi:hypothetical protein